LIAVERDGKPIGIKVLLCSLSHKNALQAQSFNFDKIYN